MESPNVMAHIRSVVKRACEKADGRLEEVQADRVLVALGRRPDLDELALDRAGVNCTPRGVITD